MAEVGQIAVEDARGNASSSAGHRG
jgi:hypothetical protein